LKLVLALRTRDQADVVDALLSFHLNAGVDFVIATDHRSEDGTAEILESYAQAGYLHLIRELGNEVRGGEWRTRMARLAASDCGADWVIGADGDEFWLPRGGSLKDALGSVPQRYGIVRCLVRSFLPPSGADTSELFAERMTVRLTPWAAIHDPASPFRPSAKVAHRAVPDVFVDRGNHSVNGPGLELLRARFPIEVLHFPMRSPQQLLDKRRTWHAQLVGRGVAQYERGRDGSRAGAERYYGSMALRGDDLRRALDSGSAVVDTRVRDALRQLRLSSAEGVRRFALPGELGSGLKLPAPELADDVAHAVDFAQLVDADAVRLRRRVDVVAARLEGRR
jgi:hypothetical protein